MPELSIEVPCRDCGTTILRRASGPGKPKLLCAACLVQSQRKSMREYTQRIRAANRKVPTHTGCRDCGKPWDKPRHRSAQCPDCRQAANREYQRQLRASRPKEVRIFLCTACGVVIDRKGKSGLPRFCPPCGEEARQESIRRTTAKQREQRGTTFATHCHYCGVEFDEPRQRARMPARCFTCKRQWHYAYMRARTTRTRGTSSPCVDCQRPVPLKRKGPKKVRCGSCRDSHQRAQWVVYARVHNNVRRARKLGAGAEKFSSSEIFERDGWRCGVCRRKVRRALKHPHPMSASLDHRIPLSAGGQHSRANTQIAHLRCNLKKNRKIENVQMALFG